MKELKATLQEHPFNLKEEEATLVSRYIVEDSANEYVYWDEENEINRNIAKSIIRALIGDYELPDMVRVKDEWGKLKSIYLSNIVTALKTIAPKGLVSLKKLVELLVGLGIEMT
jgi:NADH:ubiquinone oxidoreductase subunit H